MTTIDTTASGLSTERFSGPTTPATTRPARSTTRMFDHRRPALIAQCRNTEDVVAAVKLRARQRSARRGAGPAATASPGSRCVRRHRDRCVADEAHRRRSRQSHCAGAGRRPARRARRCDAGARARHTPRIRVGDGHRRADAQRRHRVARPQARVDAATTSSPPRSSSPTARSCDASDTQNSDLMWGLRGGGGNFGIVTSFEYRLHEISEVYMEMRFFDPTDFRAVLRIFGEHAPSMSDDFVGAAVTLTVPHSEMFPEELHGRFLSRDVARALRRRGRGEAGARARSKVGRSRCSRWA